MKHLLLTTIAAVLLLGCKSMQTSGLSDLPVIALAQLNRSIENDNNRSPQLSDLRESGSIEADSDVVIFIHREGKGVFIESRMLCRIVVGKNRNGPQGVFDLCFDRDVCRFEDWRKHQDLLAEAEKLRS